MKFVTHISLYSLLEHLFSNVGCIKTSLTHIAKYIRNKKINSSKAIEIKYLQEISKVVWKFVLAFYNTEWDSLIADIHNNSFRQKVSYHCMPKMNNIKTSKLKSKEIDKLASVERLSSSIPTKTPKEVNEISKFFKAKAPTHTTVK